MPPAELTITIPIFEKLFGNTRLDTQVKVNESMIFLIFFFFYCRRHCGMKLLSLAVALAAILQVSEAIAQKPFFPSASAPTSDEVGTAGLAFKQTSSNAYDNPNSRPQISPPFQGQKPQISPVYQGQQSQNQGQTRPQVQPVQGQTGPGPHVVQPIVQDKPQISPVDPSATDSHKVEPRQLTSYQQGETSYGSPSNTLYQQQAGYNWGYSGSTGGTIACTVCSPNVYTYAQKCCSLGYTQCCNVGVHGGNYNNGGYNSYQAQLYPQHQGYQYSTYNSYPNSQWSISSWPYSAGGGLGYQQGWNSLGKSREFSYFCFMQSMYVLCVRALLYEILLAIAIKGQRTPGNLSDIKIDRASKVSKFS
jgi:hypothetical protein